MDHDYSSRGFTTFELIAVVAAILLLLVLAWPSLQARRKVALGEELRQAMDKGNRDDALRLLELGAPPDAWSGETPHFCLMCSAIRENDVEMVRQLAQSITYTREAFPRHCQPLLLMAANLPSLEIAEILLDAGTPVAQRVRCPEILPPYHLSDQSPLGAALERNDEAMVNLLLSRATDDELQHPAPLEEPIGNDALLLHKAVTGGNPDLLKRLLERGVPVNSVNKAGETALHIAAQQADQEAIELLLAYGANPAIEDRMHELPEDNPRSAA
jgi:ankyrin repeat protein